MIIGQTISFGGGWTAAPSPMLNRAKLVARDRAIGTGWPLTILEEDIEPGTIVDTHLEFENTIAGEDGSADDIERSTGFVQVFDDRFTVQVYQPHSIGLLPYASESRIVRVPQWRPLWASPLIQFIVSSLVLLASLFSLVFAYAQAKDKLPAVWSSKERQ